MIDLATARTAIDHQIDRCIDLLSSIEDWATPTRLEGWTVADLAGHLVFGQRLQADAWQRLAAADQGAASAEPFQGDDRAAVSEALRSASADLGAALDAVTDDAAAAGACTMPYGTMPAMFVLQLATMEVGVHASDLAAAAGQDDVLDETTITAAGVVLGGALPLLGAGGDGTAPAGTSVALRAPGLELAAVRADAGWEVQPTPAEPTTTISGSASDVVLFALGRRTAAAMDVAGDPAAAEQFKAWFPGP